MGLYTEVVIDDQRGQVKLWNGHPEMVMATVKVGDQVPSAPVTGHYTYSVAMQEGGYLHIVHGFVTGWKPERLECAPVFDKWGEPHEE